jgi:hypothetical protein
MQLIDSKTTAAVKADAKIAALVETISVRDLQEWVRTIAVPRHFSAQAERNRWTAEWIAGLLRDWGYRAQKQGTSSNIVAEPEIDLAGREVVIVGAHYDSVPMSPGADDNGSAVAALLGCAAACALWRPTPAVVFVAFNREEDGMIGSRDFVEKFLPTAPYRVRCAHILEMVGFATSQPGSQATPTALPIKLRNCGDFLGLLANSDSRAEMDFVIERTGAYAGGLHVTGLEVPPGAELVFPVLARSDHAPFWPEDIPAMLWTDTAEFRNPNYHLASDTADTLNYDFLRRVCQLLTASVI